jgi:hypothetical protein
VSSAAGAAHLAWRESSTEVRASAADAGGTAGPMPPSAEGVDI